MPIEERRERWATMMERLRSNTVQAWCQGFLDSLRSVSVESTGLFIEHDTRTNWSVPPETPSP
jgi:trehalose-6-phosphate synthase